MVNKIPGMHDLFYLPLISMDLSLVGIDPKCVSALEEHLRTEHCLEFSIDLHILVRCCAASSKNKVFTG